jgi:hypothetical protein
MLQRHPSEIVQSAAVVAAANRRKGDPRRRGARYDQLHGECHADLAHRISTIDFEGRACIQGQAGFALRVHTPAEQLAHIVRKVSCAMRVNSTLVGIDQAMG